MKCIHVDHQTHHKLSQELTKRHILVWKTVKCFWISINFVNTCLNLHFLRIPVIQFLIKNSGSAPTAFPGKCYEHFLTKFNFNQQVKHVNLTLTLSPYNMHIFFNYLLLFNIFNVIYYIMDVCFVDIYYFLWIICFNQWMTLWAISFQNISCIKTVALFMKPMSFNHLNQS